MLEMAGPRSNDEQDQASTRCIEIGSTREREVKQVNRLRKGNCKGDERSGQDLERNQLSR